MKLDTQEQEYKASQFNLWQSNEGKVYIVNTLSKSIIEIKTEEKNYVKRILSGDALLKKDEKFFEYQKILIDQGNLVKKEFNEKAALGYLYRRSHFSDSFLNITIIPTMRCNFKCPYCFETEKGIHWNDERVESLKKFALVNFPQKQSVQLNFFGGEPLLEWNRIKNFLGFCVELENKNSFQLVTGITTNGYLMDEEKAIALLDEYHCKGIQITIDGCRESHDQTRVLHNGSPSFDRVLGNFKNLLKVKSRRPDNRTLINLRVNLLNNSKEQAEELLSNFSNDEKKFFTAYFRPIYNTKNFCVSNENQSNLEEFYQLLDLHHIKRFSPGKSNYSYCEGDSGLNTFELLPDLTVWKCINDDKCDDAKLGEINSEGQLIAGIEKLAKWSCNDPFSDDNCKNCSYLPLCYGGCPLHYLKTGEKNCFYEKHFNLVKHLMS
ncbi:MAG: radical SAM protein [Spirochaetales bacterium]|nr:radical SAM protein [Spirochaetales bacterium]